MRATAPRMVAAHYPFWAPPYPQRAMKVLLTNDDGIEADGLQALRRALLEGPRGRARRHRPRRQPLRDGPLDHDAPPAVGGGGRLRRRHRRLRDRRHARRLRRLAKLGLIDGFEAEIVVSGINHGSNLGDDITYSGHRGRRARGRRPRPPGARGLASSPPPASSTSASAGTSTSRPPRDFTARVVAELDDVPLQPGDAAQHQRPRRATRGRRRHPPRQAHLPRRAEAERGGRGPPALLDLRRRPRLPRRGGHRPGRGRGGPHRGDAAAFRPDRPRRDGRAASCTTSRGCSSPRPRRSSERRRRRRPPPRRRAARAARPPRAPLLRPRRPGDRRRRVRRALRRAAGPRGGSTPSSRRRTRRPSASAREPVSQLTKVRHELPMLALANARSAEELRAWVRACAPTSRARGSRTRLRLRLRAEDRRPGDLAALRGRPLRPRRDARQRRGRRGRHPQPAHDRVDPAAGSRTRRRCSRSAARSTCRCPTSPRSTSAAPRRACRRS